MRDYIRKNNQEKGAIVVEACLIFPIVIFMLVFIIYLGEIYYQMAKVDDIVRRYAIKGAEWVADPFLRRAENGNIDSSISSEDLGLEPYRYVTSFLSHGYINNVVGDISDLVEKEIKDVNSSFLSGVSLKYVSSDYGDECCEYNGGFFSSSFIVQVNCEVTFPFFWLGKGNGMQIMKISARSEVGVNDMDEFVRNLDMVIDLAENTKFGNKVKGWFDKMNSFIKKFSDA